MPPTKFPVAALLLATTMLAGCSETYEKLKGVGNPPPMAKIADPVVKPDYKPMSWPMPETPPPSRQYANTLWQSGSRTFFRDQRASRVGDILKVSIKINDKAQINNETERKRDATDSASVGAALGLETKIPHYIPGLDINTDNLVEAEGATKSKGTGTIKRQEIITTQVAALVTQILPNGNMVIDGSQELLINYDIRQVSIKGVVRPEDIRSDNTIDSTQVAEARIIYGGRGQLMDVQQPRWGAQVLETLSPF